VHRKNYVFSIVFKIVVIKRFANTQAMRANKRFLFTLGIVGFWTILTYFIVIKNHSDFQNGKSKFRDKVANLEREVEEEARSRQQIIQQYKSLIEILDRKPTAAPSAAAIESNLAPLEEDGSNNNNNQNQPNNKIDFNGKYIGDDVNSPVIPVIVFACNRVSVSRNLDALIKYRPSREQFPIIVSQVSIALFEPLHN
jgi:alpha-1,3-mannosyl-glycoprotein beta-1,2-N-acetylglucosaminyltransferase